MVQNCEGGTRFYVRPQRVERQMVGVIIIELLICYEREIKAGKICQ